MLGTFAGHSHQDWDATEDGIVHVVTQGCGGCPYTWLLPEARYTHREDPGCSLIVDVVALKPEKGMGRIFRIGAGGEAFDRPFPHAAYGASSAEMRGNAVHFVCPSLLRPVSFSIGWDELSSKGLFSSEMRRGVRLVKLDVSAGWTRAEALEFLRSETMKGDLTAVLLNRPLWTPGRSDVPFGNPAERNPPQAWRNYELRDHVMRKMPNLLGVFAQGDCYSLAVQSGRAHVTCPKGGAFDVSVN